MKKKTILHVFFGIFIGLLIAFGIVLAIWNPLGIEIKSNFSFEEAEVTETEEPPKEIEVDEATVESSDDINLDLYYFLIQGNYKAYTKAVPGKYAYFYFKDNRQYSGFSSDVPYGTGKYEISRDGEKYFVTVTMDTGATDKYELVFPSIENTILLKTDAYEFSCKKIDEYAEGAVNEG